MQAILLSVYRISFGQRSYDCNFGILAGERMHMSSIDGVVTAFMQDYYPEKCEYEK